MPMTRRLRTAAALAMIAALGLPAAACSTHSADTYSRDEMGQAMAIDRGTVLSVRQVKVEGTESGVGAASGAAIGGIGGYQIGGDRSVNAIGAIGGAVIGGLIGLAAEKGLTSDTAEEVIVRDESGVTRAYIQKMDDPAALQPGDRVLVMRGAKTRVVKDTSGVAAPPAGTAPTRLEAPQAGGTSSAWPAPGQGEASAYQQPATVTDGRIE